MNFQNIRSLWYFIKSSFHPKSIDYLFYKRPLLKSRWQSYWWNFRDIFSYKLKYILFIDRK